MKHKKTSLFAFALAFAVAPTVDAGPWVPQAGHGYAKLGTRALLGARYTDGAGETTPIAGYREFTTSMYGELGVGRSLALLLQWDVARLFQLAETDRSAFVRPGDLHLGARWAALHFGRGVLSVDGWFGIPIAKSEALGTLFAEDGRSLAELRAGPGVLDVAADVSVGWAWTAVYTSASVGWLQRTGGQDGGLRWRAEVGGRWRRLFGAVRLSGWHPLDTGDAPLLENPAALTNGSMSTSTVVELGVVLDGGFRVGATSQLSMAGLGVRRHARGAVFSAFVSVER